MDSFGLEGLHNECGGIYSIQNSMINACFPPLSWQTYDIDFVNARGTIETKESNARLTVKLNGIPIHDGFEIPGKTGGSRDGPEGTQVQSNYRGTTTLFNSETFGLFLIKQIAQRNRFFIYLVYLLI